MALHPGDSLSGGVAPTIVAVMSGGVLTGAFEVTYTRTVTRYYLMEVKAGDVLRSSTGPKLNFILLLLLFLLLIHLLLLILLLPPPRQTKYLRLYECSC
jgi:amino acid permease